MREKTLGEVNYEAFANHLFGGKYTPWNDLDPDTRDSWEVAGQAMSVEVRTRLTEGVIN